MEITADTGSGAELPEISGDPLALERQKCFAHPLTTIIGLVSVFVRACRGLLASAALAVVLAGSLAGIASAATAVPSVAASFTLAP